MAIYSALTDYKDPELRLEARLLDAADVRVNAILGANGILLSELTLPIPLLTQLAVAIGNQAACIEQGRGQNQGLLVKAAEYGKQIKELSALINRPNLGIAYPTGSSFGSCTIGRG